MFNLVCHSHSIKHYVLKFGEVVGYNWILFASNDLNYSTKSFFVKLNHSFLNWNIFFVLLVVSIEKVSVYRLRKECIKPLYWLNPLVFVMMPKNQQLKIRTNWNECICILYRIFQDLLTRRKCIYFVSLEIECIKLKLTLILC